MLLNLPTKIPKKRVAIDCRELEKGKFTGIGRVILNFLSSLEEFEDSFDFLLYSDNKTDRTLLNTYSKKVLHLNTSNPFVFDHLLLPLSLIKNRVDLYFSPYIKIPFFTSIPSVSFIHDLLFLKVYRKNLKNQLYPLYLKIVTKKAAAVIVPSNSSREDLKKFCNCDPKKVHIIPYGIERNFTKIRSNKVYEALKTEFDFHDKKYLLYVSNFREHKNLFNLLLAYSSLPEKIRKEYKLLLVGEINFQKEKITSFISEKNLEEKIIFCGKIDFEEVKPFLKNSFAVVFPSLYEGFGLPVLEALKFEVPVLVSNTSSLPEVAGEAAIYFDPFKPEEIARSMEKIITDKKLYHDLKLKTLFQAEKFTLELFSNKLMNLFKDIIK